jgi:hypothetical protein
MAETEVLITLMQFKPRGRQLLAYQRLDVLVGSLEGTELLEECIKDLGLIPRGAAL